MELFHGRPMVFIGSAAIAAALCGWYFDGCTKLILAATVLSAFVLCALLRIFGKSPAAIPSLCFSALRRRFVFFCVRMHILTCNISARSRFAIPSMIFI